MVELKRKNKERIIPASEMKDGQIGEIVSGYFSGVFVQFIIILRKQYLISVGSTLAFSEESFRDIKVRLLEEGDTIVITEN